MSIDAPTHAPPPQKAHQPAGPRNTSQPFIVGPNVSLTGILQVDGEVWVEGYLEADVRCQSLIVGPAAHIDGVIVAGTVEVYGSAFGEVFSNKVVVKEGARVEAEINYQSLVIEADGYFEGRSRRHRNPIGLSPSFAPAG
ncbi:MAG: bactofilin family protein [Hyphomicrobiaceae bacterium]